MKGEVSNIGHNAIQKRQKMGAILLVIAGFLSGFLIAMDTPFFARIIVFPFFAGGFISLIQAHRKVCVYNAWKKTKDME